MHPRHYGQGETCQACQWKEKENEELRQRMARALVVIEALRKRNKELERGGGGGGDDGPTGFASLDPVGGGAAPADAAVMRAAAEVLVQEATSGLQVELEATRQEVKAARQVVVELEVQVVEKDTLASRLQTQLNALKGQLREVSSNPHLAPDKESAVALPPGSGPQNQSLVVNAEEHRREIASLWKRIQEGINELRVARAEKEELKERLRCDALGREAFELQRLRLQRLHREMAHSIEEHRHKCEALESNWVRWVLKATEAHTIGMLYLRPLKRHAAAAIRGLDAGSEGATKTIEQLTGGAPRFVVASGEYKNGRIEVFARQKDDLPVVCFSVKKSRVEIIDGEFNFLIFGYYVPDDMTSGGGGAHDDSEPEDDYDDDDDWGAGGGGGGRSAVHGERGARGGAKHGVGDWDDEQDWDGFDFDDDMDDIGDDDVGDPNAHPGHEQRMPDFIVECDRLQASPQVQYRKWHNAFRTVGLLENQFRSTAQ